MKTTKSPLRSAPRSLTSLGVCTIFLACGALPLAAFGQTAPAAPAAASKSAQVVYDANGKPIGVQIQESNGEFEFVPMTPGAASAPAVQAPQAPAMPTSQAGSMPPGPPPPAGVASTPTPPPLDAQEVNFAYFHDQLAPFGSWIQVGDLGMVWRPDSALAANPEWRPYYDQGQWVYTDNGWFWASDYTWGDIPFHYGRWVRNPSLGWVWAPDYTWGPSWVAWRHAEAEGSIGWAPLPPGAVFVDGAMRFHGVAVGLDFDFGLAELDFNFIGYDHFHDDFFRLRDPPFRYEVPRERIHEFYPHTVLRNDFHRDTEGRFVNEGLGRDRVALLTHHPVEVVHADVRTPVGDRKVLVDRPVVRGAPAVRGAPDVRVVPAVRGAQPDVRGAQPPADKRVFIPPAPKPQPKPQPAAKPPASTKDKKQQ